jgi:hypothetical protein
MTSIEWLIKQLSIYGDKAFNKEITLGQYHIKKNELIEQAKLLHKQEHERTFIHGVCERGESSTERFEQYYQETFKKD